MENWHRCARRGEFGKLSLFEDIVYKNTNFGGREFVETRKTVDVRCACEKHQQSGAEAEKFEGDRCQCD